MFETIDSFLLKVHQKVIEAVQLDPIDVSKQLVVLYMILRAIVQNYIGWDDLAGLFAFGFLVAIYSLLHIKPKLIEMMSKDYFVRQIVIVCFVLGILMNAVIFFDEPGQGLAGIASNFVYLAIFYFAACNKPTPKKKTQTSTKFSLFGA